MHHKNLYRAISLMVVLFLFVMGFTSVAGQEITEEPAPVVESTEEPIVEPTQEPTVEPTIEPTQEPIVEPTIAPTVEVTEEPIIEPTAEPTEEPLPTVEVTEVPVDLFQDDFQDGSTAGWQISGDWQVAAEGGNSFLTSSAAGSAAVVAGADWPHVLFAARVRVSEGGSLLVNVRAGVSVSVDAAGQASLLVNGAVVAQGAPTGSADGWRLLNIQALGDTITVAVERSIQFSQTDAGFAGAGGLSISSGGGTVAFDDVMVNRLDAPVVQPTPESQPTTEVVTAPEIDANLSADEMSLLDRAMARGTVRVIVGLGGRYDNTSHLDAPSDAQMDMQFQLAQRGRSDLLAGLHSAGAQVTLDAGSNDWVIPFAAMEVDAAGLLYLFSSRDVISIEEDRLEEAHLASSLPVIGADVTRSNGFDGSGQAVVVLDTGVQSNHEFLTGAVIAEACFGTNSGISTSLCPNGNEQQVGTGAASPTARCVPRFNDNGYDGNASCSHGTHVAGIIAGNNTSPSGVEPLYGVAPEAHIIAINVFSYIPEAYGGADDQPLAWVSDQVDALNWVFANRNNYNIAAINMSLGGGGYTSANQCKAQNQSRFQITKKLRGAGITTVASAGNSGYVNALGAPACLSTVVSVGSTMDDDSISYFSNRANFMNLFAPGHFIDSSVLVGVYQSYNGTSMSAPHVAGAYALLREAKPNATPAAMLNALRQTGTPITITGGKRIPRINVDDAVARLLPKPKRVKLAEPRNNHFTNQTSITLEWKTAQHGVTYQVQIDDAANFKTVNYSATVGGLSHTFDGLTEGRWFWRVRALNALGAPGPWSSKWRFNVDLTPPGPTILLKPNTGATLSTARPALKWRKAVQATQYRIQIDDDPAFGSPLVNAFPVKKTNYKPAALPDGTYYWRVQPYDKAGNSNEWSEIFSFTIN